MYLPRSFASLSSARWIGLWDNVRLEDISRLLTSNSGQPVRARKLSVVDNPALTTCDAFALHDGLTQQLPLETHCIRGNADDECSVLPKGCSGNTLNSDSGHSMSSRRR